MKHILRDEHDDLGSDLPSKPMAYKQHPDIIGYARKSDLAPLLDRAQPAGSHISIGLDHPVCWEDESPYDHLVALYTRPAQGEPVVKLRDGELIKMANKAAPHPTRDNDMFYIAMGRLVEDYYTHADPAEVAQWKASAEHYAGVSAKATQEVERLRAGLTEAHALLRRAVIFTHDLLGPTRLRRDIEKALSASAEPRKEDQ